MRNVHMQYYHLVVESKNYKSSKKSLMFGICPAQKSVVFSGQKAPLVSSDQGFFPPHL